MRVWFENVNENVLIAQKEARILCLGPIASPVKLCQNKCMKQQQTGGQKDVKN